MALSSLRALNAQGAEARSRAGLVGTKLAELREEGKQPFPFTGHRTCLCEQYQPPSSPVILPIPIWAYSTDSFPRALSGGQPASLGSPCPPRLPQALRGNGPSLCVSSHSFSSPSGGVPAPAVRLGKPPPESGPSVAIYIVEKFSSIPDVGGTKRARVPLRARGNALGLVLRGRRRARQRQPRAHAHGRWPARRC